ncbi:pilus assembly protein (plasmid) [Peteryoungia desertarenae]|uniref:Pilus assembly protein n=1 Tax=Peteryoungia desertarenae TaxID=1813451 RepID=A0ABX6QSL8_9HYPH|nr:TadE family protein [Peteryoungia desertarenae]QLF71601.1 pilus assembly protein [Peteryoungia desertarenae]
MAKGSKFRSRWCRLATDRGGSTAVEFALVAPLFLSLLFSAIEMGWVMTQSMVLESAVNRTARSMQVNAGTVSAKDFKASVCEHASILKNCEENLIFELSPVGQKSDIPSDQTPCIDRANAATPVTKFNPGSGNEIVFGRACFVVDPLTPGLGVALSLPLDASGGLRLTARFAFVTEAI